MLLTEATPYTSADAERVLQYIYQYTLTYTHTLLACIKNVRAAAADRDRHEHMWMETLIHMLRLQGGEDP